MNESTSRGRFHLIVSSLLVCLLGIAMLSVSPVARAATFTLDCVGGVSQSYSPGATLNLQSITYTDSDTLSCIPGLGAPVGLTGESHTSSATTSLSCVVLLQTGFVPPPITYHWNNGMQSVVKYTSATIDSVEGNTVVTLSGTVQSGVDTGAIAVEVLALTNSQLLSDNCSSPQGLTSAAGIATLNFL